jgi:phage repressor protein C with HTH and peptisase S24 domain
VLEVDGAAIVKQVQRLGGGVIDVIPRNPLYERERFVPLPDADTPTPSRSELPGLTSQLRFVGKVVYSARPA